MPNQYEDKELFNEICDLTEAVSSTGAEAKARRDKIMQLITQKQLEARHDELSAVVSVIRSEGSSARLVISIKQMEDRLAELKKGLQS